MLFVQLIHIGCGIGRRWLEPSAGTAEYKKMGRLLTKIFIKSLIIMNVTRQYKINALSFCFCFHQLPDTIITRITGPALPIRRLVDEQKAPARLLPGGAGKLCLEPLLLGFAKTEREGGVGVEGYEGSGACLPGKPGGRLLVASCPAQVVPGNEIICIAVIVMVAGKQKAGYLPFDEGRQLLKKRFPLHRVAAIGRQVTQPNAEVNPMGCLPADKQCKSIPATLTITPGSEVQTVSGHIFYALLPLPVGRGQCLQAAAGVNRRGTLLRSCQQLRTGSRIEQAGTAETTRYGIVDDAHQQPTAVMGRRERIKSRDKRLPPFRPLPELLSVVGGKLQVAGLTGRHPEATPA